jgi:hypothetical protein
MLNGWALVIWRADCKMSLQGTLSLRDEDLAWLQEALQMASHPAVLCLHVPIDEHSLIGNYYFEHRPDLARYSNGASARSLIEQSELRIRALQPPERGREI